MEYLYASGIPKIANDIFENCVKRHSLNQETFNHVLFVLSEREVIRRISISESRFAFELTERGKALFQVVYMPAVKPFIDLLFDYRTNLSTK